MSFVQAVRESLRGDDKRSVEACRWLAAQLMADGSLNRRAVLSPDLCMLLGLMVASCIIQRMLLRSICILNVIVGVVLGGLYFTITVRYAPMPASVGVALTLCVAICAHPLVVLYTLFAHSGDQK